MNARMWLTGLGAGSLVVAGTLAAGPLPGAAQQAMPLLAPAVDVIESQEIALNTQVGAEVIAVNLDDDDGLLTYGVALDNGVELAIDATTGAVIRAEERNAAGYLQCAHTALGNDGGAIGYDSTIGDDDDGFAGDDDGGFVGGDDGSGYVGGYVGNDDDGGYVGGDDDGGDDDGSDD